MTLVAALRCGPRVVMMSDTAISNRDAAHPNALPGRLKAIVLNEKTTVAYAGLSSQALDVVRALPRSLDVPADALLADLTIASRRFADDLDFLLCSHENPTSPRLVKVCSGSLYEGADFYWIGAHSAANTLAKFEVPHPELENPPDFQSEDERRFTRVFAEYVESSRDPTVGGAAINCLCSPHGHCYQDYVVSRVWDVTITIPSSTTEAERQAHHLTGMNSYTCHIYTSPVRGLALVGLYLEQAALGFLHVPLEEDDPRPVRAPDQGAFARLVTSAARDRSDA